MHTFLTDVMHARTRDVLPSSFIDYYHQSVIRGTVTHPFLLIHHLFVPFTIKDEFFVPEMLAMVHCPKLIMVSENDPLLPLTQSALDFREREDYKIKHFKMTGHVPSIERSEEFNSNVLAFLKATV